MRLIRTVDLQEDRAQSDPPTALNSERLAWAVRSTLLSTGRKIDMEPASASAAVPPTVIAFINPKSGGGLGQRLLEKLQVILGDDHVFSLIPDGPEPGCALVASAAIF